MYAVRPSAFARTSASTKCGQPGVDLVDPQTVTRCANCIEPSLSVARFDDRGLHRRHLGDDPWRAAARPMPANDFFGIAVGRRRVDDVDARLEGAHEDRRDLALVRPASTVGNPVTAAELCRAQPDA